MGRGSAVTPLDVAVGMVAKYQFTIRRYLASSRADSYDSAVYWAVVDTVIIAYGFTQDEARGLIDILTREV